jgi:hypothetical protein
MRKGGADGYYCVREVPADPATGRPATRTKVQVSFLEHVQCMVSAKSQTTSGTRGSQVQMGVENVGSRGTADAAFDSAMTRITNAIPPTTAPRNPEEAQALSDQTPAGGSYVNSQEALDRMIDREFSGVNQEGFDVSGVVKQAFDSCFRKMSSQVTNDLNAAARDDGTASSTGSATNPNSMVVNAQQQFTALERQKLAEMNQVLTSYQQAYQNATQSLTLARMEMPIDPEKPECARENDTQCKRRFKKAPTEKAKGNIRTEESPEPDVFMRAVTKYLNKSY